MIDLGDGVFVFDDSSWRTVRTQPHYASMGVRRPRDIRELTVSSRAFDGNSSVEGVAHDEFEYQVRSRKRADLSTNAFVAAWGTDTAGIWLARPIDHLGAPDDDEAIDRALIGYSVVVVGDLTDKVKLALRKLYGLLFWFTGNEPQVRTYRCTEPLKEFVRLYIDKPSPILPEDVLRVWPHVGYPGELKRGQVSRQVRVWQTRLVELGETPGRIDARFGPATELATVSLQARRGLDPTGKVDELTWKEAFS